MKFEFDEWATLHKVDPEAFEVRRSATLERLLQSVDEESRHALEQTLFRAEMVRKRSKSPLQGAIEASNLMWESFGKLRDKVNELESLAQTTSVKKNTLRLVTDELSGKEQLSTQFEQIQNSQADAHLPSARVFQFPAKR